jgi:CubicO group peptidase (beta-lactamase class C family)
MKRLLIIFVMLTSLHLIAQDGPPSKENEAISASIHMLMQPSGLNPDLSGYIELYYSEKLKSSTNKQSLIQKLQLIRSETAGAAGIDIGIENGTYRLMFSEGKNAVVLIKFDESEKGKIAFVELEEKKDSSLLSEEERYQDAVKNAVRKVESLSRYKEEGELMNFANENFSPDLITSLGENQLIKMLRDIGLAIAASNTISGRPGESDEVILEFRGGKSADVSFVVSKSEPYLIDKFEVNTNISSGNPMVEGDVLEMTMDNYRQLLKFEEQKGFSGTVLLVKDGKVFHHAGYGMADKERAVRNSTETLFDIGSIPIDFTRAAVLKLVDDGKINYSDKITKYIDNVPEDKSQITIEHLMTDKSGLPNFHGDESKDDDLDLTWIDRDEAIRRMMNSPLLFKPGTDRIPSHSGYGLLAAIVEIVSGKTFEEYLHDNFFKKMGMTNTGQYGKKPGFDPKIMAVGYEKQASKPNIPANWGNTSWLIKGSGGMVSNPYDLYLWNTKLYEEGYLSQESKEKYGFGFISVGGSERGFYSAYMKNAENAVFLCANSDRNEYADTRMLFRSLSQLVKN